jgi:myo-inositol-1(or 4)-monophosphatase
MINRKKGMEDVLAFSRKLAISTGDLLRKYYNPAGVNATLKTDQTVVTDADMAADHFISQEIKSHFPGDEIISEESSHSISDIHSPTWIIDPLDGTTNFSLGLAIWGISIARLIDGYPEIATIYFPLINELYTAHRGSGAFLNDKLITTRPPDPAHPMSFFACCSRSFRYFDISIPYKPRILGSSAYSFCMVARGTALLALDAVPKIWDLSAVWLLVQEAGGVIDAFDGPRPLPISPQVDYTRESFTLLAAADRKLFENSRGKIHRRSSG